MWALVVYFTTYGAPPVYTDSEPRCMELMAVVQRHNAPQNIKLMTCKKVRETYEQGITAEPIPAAGIDRPIDLR